MLENEYFIFTGTLTTMTRKQAQSIIEGLKGHNQRRVTKKTTRLIKGNFSVDLMQGYHPSQKEIDVEQAIRLGQPIITMSEKEFVRFLAQMFQLLSKGL